MTTVLALRAPIKTRCIISAQITVKRSLMKIQRNIHGQHAISILNQEELRAKRHRNGNTFFLKTSDI
jgi:hypothetical protein